MDECLYIDIIIHHGLMMIRFLRMRDNDSKESDLELPPPTLVRDLVVVL